MALLIKEQDTKILDYCDKVDTFEKFMKNQERRISAMEYVGDLDLTNDKETLSFVEVQLALKNIQASLTAKMVTKDDIREM